MKTLVLIALLLPSTPAAGEQRDRPGWPPFLPPASTFPATVVRDVERVWRAPTFSRTVRGRAAHVPFDVYAAFVDAPDVTAAAARHLGLAKYVVTMKDRDTYEADDGDGAHGRYRVLLRSAHRRVILSWGEHSGRFLGTIRGSALSVMDFDDERDAVGQRITAHVLIDNAVAAHLARVFITLFGGLADRKLVEGFAVSAKVAEWAMAHPDEFTAWAGQDSIPDRRREAVLAAVRHHGAMASPALTPPRP